MLELHLGKELRLNDVPGNAPILLLGRQGQGKSSFAIQFALELIRNRRPGLLYDPYGDMAEKIEQMVQTPYAKSFLVTDFIIHRGNKFEDGSEKTRKDATQLLIEAMKTLNDGAWLVIDDFVDLMSQELFEELLKASKRIKLLLSAETLVGLSEEQRNKLLETISTVILYKPRAMDAKWLHQYDSLFKEKDIAAIKQYCFQFKIGEQYGYDSVPWPYKEL
jgi:archaellum biogenesis ATPase FlaH